MAQPPSPPPPPPPPGAPPPPPSPGAPPPPPAPTGQWYSLRGLTTALTILLGVAAITAVAGAVAYARRVGIAGDIIDGDRGFDTANRFNDAGDFVQTVSILFIGLQLAIAVLTIIWTWRAMKNNEALGRTDARFTPGWGIAGWLIPCANLVIPVLIFQDLWRGSDSSVPRGSATRGSASGSGLIAAWWVALLVSLFRFGTGQGGDDNVIDNLDEMRDLKTSDSVAVGGMIAAVAAAILYVLVLRRLAERQEACLRTQQPAGAGPTA